jgi:hypothetical protein
MIFLSDKELLQFSPKASKFICVNNAHWKNIHIYYSLHETLPQAYTQFCNKHNINISLMWAEQYLENTLQIKFQNNVELACILAETFNFSVNTKYCNSVAGLICKFLLPKLGGTCGMINNICRLLSAVTHSFEVTDCCPTKTLRGLSHLLLVTIVDTA